ncbi:MAG: cell wall hydrolase [bacterium]|nr:cell wall hydrolase [bacterium]
MNKRWTEQKYVIHFLLSVMVLVVCGGVCYGASCCQNGELRRKGAELAWAVGESDERYAAYTASEQRVIEVELLAYGGNPDTAQMQEDQNAESGQAAVQAQETPGGHAAVETDDGAGGQTAAGTGDAQGYAAENPGIGADGQAAASVGDAAYADGNADGHAVAGAAADVDGDIAGGSVVGAENGANAGAGSAANAGGAGNAGTGSAANAAPAGQSGGETGTALQADAGANGGADGAVNADTGVDGQAAVGNGEDVAAAAEQTGGRVIAVSDEDYEALLRIVQAEAGNEDTKGKILVANVVLNRVADERFPNSVYEVVFQRAGGKAQFSPIASGSYYKVVVSQDTIEAVERALAGEDYSEGALYFAARRYAGSSQMRWFDECLTKLFSYGGHEFFTS